MILRRASPRASHSHNLRKQSRTFKLIPVATLEHVHNLCVLQGVSIQETCTDSAMHMSIHAISMKQHGLSLCMNLLKVWFSGIPLQEPDEARSYILETRGVHERPGISMQEHDKVWLAEFPLVYQYIMTCKTSDMTESKHQGVQFRLHTLDAHCEYHTIAFTTNAQASLFLADELPLQFTV